MDLPVACTLTESQMRERRREILEPFRANIRRSEVLPGGYAYLLEAVPDTLIRVVRLVDLERQCCPFLNFVIRITPGDPAIRLEISGPPQAKAIIADFFGGVLSRVPVLQSAIRCPHCSHVQMETMPTDQCVVSYQCQGCHSRLRPLPDDCCVFCSYGSVKCPSVQAASFNS